MVVRLQEDLTDRSHYCNISLYEINAWLV